MKGAGGAGRGSGRGGGRRLAVGVAVIAVAICASLALTLQAFDSAINAPRAGSPPRDAGVGLVVNSPTATPDVRTISGIYEQAASAGAGRSNVYMFWDAVEPRRGEFDWGRYDALMSLNRSNDLRVTLYFSLINGEALGPFPDWIGRPGLGSVDPARVAGVVGAALERYHIVDSVVLAGETDEHFRYAEQGIPVYRGLFEAVYAELKPRHPDVAFGNVYSLHGVINRDLGHIVDGLDVGDFVGFTYFPVDPLNDIVKTPAEARKDLERALDLAGGRKAAFFEIGWSTSAFVGGGEEDQRRFVSEAFDFYGENRREIEFMTWYRQYDRPEGSCSFGAGGGGGPISVGGGAGGGGSGLGGSEYVAERLGHYVCSAGLIGADGAPKAGWGEFAARARAGS